MNRLEERALWTVQGALYTSPEAVIELYQLLDRFAIKWQGYVLAEEIPNAFKDAFKED